MLWITALQELNIFWSWLKRFKKFIPNIIASSYLTMGRVNFFKETFYASAALLGQLYYGYPEAAQIKFADWLIPVLHSFQQNARLSFLT